MSQHTITESHVLMSIGDERKFVPFQEAGRLMDSGYMKVELLNMILEPDLTVRAITNAEQRKIQEIGEKYSANK